MSLESHFSTINEVTIRLAALNDAPAIASLLLDAFVEYRPLYTEAGFAATAITPEQVENRMTEGPIWVAVCENAIVGTISVVRKSNSLYVRGMAVQPKARGHQIGKRLLNKIEEHAAEEGIKRLFLSTTPFLHRAIRLYEHAGFRRTEEGPHELFGTPLFTMENFLPYDNSRKTSWPLIE